MYMFSLYKVFGKVYLRQYHNSWKTFAILAKVHLSLRPFNQPLKMRRTT